MITLFRNFAKSKWAIGLLALLALSLIITGGTQMDVLGALRPPQVIAAGDRSLDQTEFRQMVEQIRFQNQQRSGQAMTVEQLASDPSFAPAFGQRAQELGFLAWASDAGIRPGKELVLRQIREIEAFFDPVTQKFDETAYQARLADAKMTPAMLEQQFRDEYIQTHYGSAVAAGARMPRIYGAVIANQTQQARGGSWFVVTPAMAGSAAAPTDAQLTTFMGQNRAALTSPEFRTASLVIFNDSAGGDVAISEEKIQARFNFRKDALSLSERRTFTTLTAPNRAAADRIAAALRAGQTPSAVGRANNLQPAAYADTPRSAISDPAVSAAVFGLAANQVSAPIQARIGFVVASVASVTPGREVTLADVRSQIVEELRGQEVRAQVSTRVEAYELARSEGKSLEQAVAQVGARIIAVPAVTQDGKNRAGQQVNAPAELLEAMWKVTKGRASEVVSAGEGQYFVVRVDDVVPAGLPALDSVRPQLTQAWTAGENARLLSARADALSARLRRGEDINAVAASVGATVTTRASVRQNQETLAELGQGVLGGLFNAERGQPFSQQQQDGGIALGRVDRITAPSPALAAPEAQQWRQRLAGNVAESFLRSTVDSAAMRVKAGFDEDAARVALGVQAMPAAATPEAATPAPARPAGQ
ncbi:peptidyl-prolyl cis-trans isomerase [Brevundimonas sp.]|uniref:peptidylprolyl isomerase n=1 Tax=Brevundimonas sp. TaxID=1871086 RepID=UPI003568BFE6